MFGFFLTYSQSVRAKKEKKMINLKRGGGRGRTHQPSGRRGAAARVNLSALLSIGAGNEVL